MKEELTFINMLKAVDRHSLDLNKLFKSSGLTSMVQYNVLRILRGAGEQGLPSLEIARRLINRLPDITRILDRMAKEALITRTESTKDRRCVIIQLTKKGRDLVNSLDLPVQEMHKIHFKQLTENELDELNRLLNKVYNFM